MVLGHTNIPRHVFNLHIPFWSLNCNNVTRLWWRDFTQIQRCSGHTYTKLHILPRKIQVNRARLLSSLMNLTALYMFLCAKALEQWSQKGRFIEGPAQSKELTNISLCSKGRNRKTQCSLLLCPCKWLTQCRTAFKYYVKSKQKEENSVWSAGWRCWFSFVVALLWRCCRWL